MSTATVEQPMREEPRPPVPVKVVNRSHLVDVVRGIAISLVCLGHTDQGIENRDWWGASGVGYYLDQFIYAFHMPAFFVVSGIFLSASVAKRGPAAFVRAKIGQLLYPYLVWSVISYLLTYPLHRFTRRPVDHVPDIFFALVTGGIFWFLPAVFCCYLLGMLFRFQSKAVVFLGAILLSLIPLTVPVAVLLSTLHYFPFMVMGMWIGSSYAHLDRLSRPLAAGSASVLAAFILWVTTTPYLHNRIVGLLLGLVGTGMLFLVARCFPREYKFSRIMAWVGEASFGVYVMSEYGQGFGREVLVRLAHTTNPYLQLLFPTLLAIVAPALLYQKRVRLKLAWLFSWPSAPAS